MELKEFLQLYKTYTYDNLTTKENFLAMDSDYFEMSMDEMLDNFLMLDKNKKFIGYYRFGFNSYSEEDIIQTFKDNNVDICEEEIRKLLTLVV